MFRVFRLRFGRTRKFQGHMVKGVLGLLAGVHVQLPWRGGGGVGQEADADTTKGFVLCVVFRHFFEGSGLKH